MDLSEANLTKSQAERVDRLYNFSRKYGKIVLWGYWKETHTHAFIHLGYYEFFLKMGIPVIWLDNTFASNRHIEAGDLVMIPDNHLSHHGKRLLKHKFREDVSYVLHRGQNLLDRMHHQYDPGKCLYLLEHRNPLVAAAEKEAAKESWGECVYFFEKTRQLIQPWGTDLLPWEFYSPVFNRNEEVYYVGSIWGDKAGQRSGNVRKIEEIEGVLSRKGLKLVRKKGISTRQSIEAVRKSRLSFCVGAINHDADDYLQCRMFKNISYGQPTITDVGRFKNILKESFVLGDDWESRIDKVLTLSEAAYLELGRAQQEKIADYTYLDMWLNIFGALNRLETAK